MLKFAKIESSSGRFPKQIYDDRENQSYGFNDARKLQTGNTRGTQTVGYGGAKIDGANNRITITDPATGQIMGFGIIPNTTNEFGFFSLDSSGNLITKIVNGTTYVYKPNNQENFLQSGILPDGTGGFIITKDGTEVADVFV